ncbi:hypothetical protein [Actinokineospora sp. NBRC 105648]|uniref:hypothetical protein n=1 Tax=Actinokineospora sp. NBRC 105648 TaxID=3032206 RepID=UPI0024A06417|nr:hypothetical protein [Actinokineospora sp. NBRC 105648]GLZ43717.1 hypothetical protein Acsp05_73410 [Actinokineospora sp. NBRC 105648]
MLSNFKIDQSATFAGLVFLSCEPKLKFNSTEQDRTKAGAPKWELQVLGAFRGFGGGTSNEVVKIGMTGDGNPGQGINPFTPVSLVDFEVGVMEKTKKDDQGNERVIGVTVWFRCSDVRDVSVVQSSKAA